MSQPADNKKSAGAETLTGNDTITPPPTDFSELVRAELELDKSHDLHGAKWLEVPPRQLFGIALSGGGIRSATFNLGLLQGLQERGLLRGFDYLATVSGGGYTGAFWTQWRRLHPGQSFPDCAPKDEAEPHEISHLRRFSNFLSPTLGIFNFDTGRVIIALMNAVIPSLIGAVTFLAIILSLSISVAFLVLVAPGTLANSVMPAMMWGAFDVAMALSGFICMMVFAAAHFAAMCKIWRESIDQRVVTLSGSVLVVLAALIWGGWLGTHPQLPADALRVFNELRSCGPSCSGESLLPPSVWLYAFAPAAALMLLPIVTGLLRIADAGSISARLSLTSVADQVNSWYVFAATAWVGITIMWWIAFNAFLVLQTNVFALTSASVSSVPLAGLVVWLSRYVGSTDRSSESILQRIARFSVSIAGYLIVAFMTVAVMIMLVQVTNNDWWIATMVGMGAGAVYVLLWYDPNRVGLHDFYRGRVARGFMGAAHDTGDPSDDSTLEQADDDVRMANLRGPALDMVGPLHLVVCAANSLTPRDRLSSLDRGAESAVLSPVGFSVAEAWKRWPERSAHDDATWKAESPKLSAAVTASGAAFNTQMGSKSKILGPAMAFVMTSLGMRLGLWLRHPNRIGPTENIVRRARGLAMVEELLGWSDARNSDWVFLSDGGHFDNTGLYELVRRHCRFIVVSDCGADTDRAFDDLGSAVRRVREDFGVDIKINLEPLRPNAQGFSRQPMVAGDIHYPAGDTGTLLVMKPSLTGSEPPDVLQYRARNDQFPHQSTGDQFFDEAQWESYRRLGLHVARTAFASSTGADRHPALRDAVSSTIDVETLEERRMRMARDFGTARREWLARPVDFEQRIDRLAHAIGGLDALMPKAGSLLAQQLCWELHADAVALPPSSAPANDYLAALSALRQALVVFESAFLNEQLASQFNQPMYTGVMNVMARWMTTPLMHTWWPLLSSTCGVAFRQFAMSQFALSIAPEAFSVCRVPVDGTLALASMHRPIAHAFKDILSLRLILTLGPSVERPSPAQTSLASPVRQLSQHDVEVARLDVTTSQNGEFVMWEGRDLYVPPGLWGMGFGSRMLVGTSQEMARATSTPVVQIVLIRSLITGTPEAKKDSADLQQLYLDAGFSSAPAALYQNPEVQQLYITFAERRSNGANGAAGAIGATGTACATGVTGATGATGSVQPADHLPAHFDRMLDDPSIAVLVR